MNTLSYKAFRFQYMIKRNVIRALEWPYKAKIKNSIKNDNFNEYGGYAIVNKLPSDGVVFSFGIGEDSEFEEYILKVYPNIKLYAFDPTPTTITYMEGKPEILFYPVGLSDHDGKKIFYKNKDPKGQPWSVSEYPWGGRSNLRSGNEDNEIINEAIQHR